MKAILSAQDLAWRLGIPLATIRKLASEVDSHYREWEDVNLEKGKTRVLKVPDELLKGVQRRILKNISKIIKSGILNLCRPEKILIRQKD